MNRKIKKWKETVKKIQMTMMISTICNYKRDNNFISTFSKINILYNHLINMIKNKELSQKHNIFKIIKQKKY